MHSTGIAQGSAKAEIATSGVDMTKGIEIHLMYRLLFFTDQYPPCIYIQEHEYIYFFLICIKTVLKIYNYTYKNILVGMNTNTNANHYIQFIDNDNDTTTSDIVTQKNLNSNNNTNTYIDDNSIKNNINEIRLMITTQERFCYDMQYKYNIILKQNEEYRREIKNKNKVIQCLKKKLNNETIEKTLLQKLVLYEKNLIITPAHQSVAGAAPPPPPLPPPPPPPSAKRVQNQNVGMNSVLDELRLKITKKL